MKDSNGHEIPEDAVKLIDKRNALVELHNNATGSVNRYEIDERIRKIDETLFEVYGLI
jgi:hypothetical protein